MHVERGEVVERAVPLVLVLDAKQSCSSRREARMAAAPCLDRGLLVGRDHELVVFELRARRRSARRGPRRRQHSRRSGDRGGRSRSGSARDGSTASARMRRTLDALIVLGDARGDHLGRDLRRGEAAEREVPRRWQLAGDRRHLGDDRRTEHLRPTGALAVREAIDPLVGEALPPLRRGVHGDAEPRSRSRRSSCPQPRAARSGRGRLLDAHCGRSRTRRSSSRRSSSFSETTKGLGLPIGDLR